MGGNQLNKTEFLQQLREALDAELSSRAVVGKVIFDYIHKHL